MIKDAKFLQQGEVYLRGFKPEDLTLWRNWLDDPEVTEFLEMGARPTREIDCESFGKLAGECDTNIVFAICEQNSDKLVGTCGLYGIQWVCRRAQFNILIGDRQVWDKGYGRDSAKMLLAYGFLKLNLESIQLGVNAENKRAIRSYENAGFVREGLRRKFIYRNGRYYDVVEMSVLREEYSNTLL